MQDLGLLLLKELACFRQKLRSSRHTLPRFQSKEKTAAMGFIQGNLRPLHSRQMPATRVQKTNSQLRILVEKTRVLRVRLQRDSFKGLVTQILHASTCLPC